MVTSSAVVGSSAISEVGVVREGHRERDPLALAAGELVGVGGQAMPGNSEVDEIEPLEDPLAGRRGADRLVEAERFADLLLDRVEGIQRRHRLLEDHRYASPPERPPRRSPLRARPRTASTASPLVRKLTCRSEMERRGIAILILPGGEAAPGWPQGFPFGRGPSAGTGGLRSAREVLPGRSGQTLADGEATARRAPIRQPSAGRYRPATADAIIEMSQDSVGAGHRSAALRSGSLSRAGLIGVPGESHDYVDFSR